MNRVLLFIAGLTIFTSCNSNRTSKVISSDSTKKIKDSVVKRKAADSAATPGSDQEGPTFDEVKRDLLATYNKVGHIDTLIIIGNDSLHVHEKYYCLHDSALVIPKKYLWGGDTSKDFITHNFASTIVVVKNKDTIFNRTFKKSDFNNVVNPEEKSYASIMFPNFDGYRKKYGVIFCYSITIPLTDVGVPACIAVDLNGHYKILDQYEKIN